MPKAEVTWPTPHIGRRARVTRQLLIDQVAFVLGREPDDFDKWGRQTEAMLAAIAGIEPRDEIEGMLVAQLIASHNAAVECYRHAMLRNQTFDGRHENLKQATSNRS